MKYYQVLEINPSASQEEIKQNFRRLSKLYHPDKNNGNSIYLTRFYQIVEAYEVLGNPVSRSYYDESLSNPNNNSNTYQQSTTKSYTPDYGPRIVDFHCNQTFYFVGDHVLLTWNCKNAEFIQIFPFGYVDAEKGQIRYKIKKWDTKEITFELIAKNSYSSTVARKKIVIRNGTEFSITEQEIRNEKDVVYENAMPWGIGFIAPFGRSSRKDYLLRIAVILVFLILCILKFSENEHSEEIISLCYVMAIYAFMMCSSRRLHDIGWKGFWTFLTLFPIINVGMTIVLILYKGSELPSKHGRQPLF